MISITELTALWNAITPIKGQTIGRVACLGHALDFHIAYDENLNMELVLISDYVPMVPGSSQQILVRGNPRQSDGRHALCFSLVDQSLKEQFIFLCWDIMNYTYESKTEKAGVKSVVKRFCMWQRLFAEARDKKMSDARVKGLIGELCALKEIILKKYPQDEAISGWIGPIGADRDFELSDTWYEIKAVSLSKDIVSISSLDQLDIDEEGHLLIVRVEKTSDNVQNKITLNGLVDEIRASITDNSIRTAFDARLLSIHYDDKDDRAEEPYVMHRIEQYKVDTEFPRIRRTELSIAISEGTYSLSIPAIQDWRQH